jgi:hypothetical protein
MDKRIILKWIFKKQNVRLWTGSVYNLMEGSSEHGNEPSDP